MRTGQETALRTLLLCHGVLVAGLALSFPFLTLYLHERRGLEMSRVGLAISAGLIATAVGQAMGGELSDVWGCKRVMAASLCGRAVMTSLMAAAVAGSWPVSAVIVMHIAASWVGNLYDPAVRSCIAFEHPARGRVRAYGLLRVAANAAWAVGPAIGGLMAGSSYAMMFAATAVMCLICLGLLFGLVPSAPAARSGERLHWHQTLLVARNDRYRELALLGLVLACAMGQLVAPLSVHATRHGGLSEVQLGLLFALNGALVVSCQQAAGRVISRYRLTTALAAGCAFYAAGWSWIGFSRGWWPLAAGMVIVTCGEMVVSPSLAALAANLAPEKLRGRYLGFQGLLFQLGSAAGPLLGGVGLQYMGGQWTPAPWLAAGVLAGAAGWGFRRFGEGLSPVEQGRLCPEVL